MMSSERLLSDWYCYQALFLAVGLSHEGLCARLLVDCIDGLTVPRLLASHSFCRCNLQLVRLSAAASCAA
jgi:hypothetical protein